MASLQAPRDQSPPDPVGHGEQREGSPAQAPAERLQPPKGKEKKRVGFAGDNEPQESGSNSPRHLTPNDITPSEQMGGQRGDYFSYKASPSSNSSTPMYEGGGPAKRDSFDEDEVYASVSRMMLSSPSMPRPVLRKPTVGPASADVTTAPHRSEVEAKHRADRLAYSVGTSSVPVSRRGSFDSESQPPLDEEALLARGATTSAHDFAPAHDAEDLEPRRRAELEADRLVRRHTRRKSPMIRAFFPSRSRSGTATPVDHDLEYVPPPETFETGILPSLLKLRGMDDSHTSPFSSAPSTPSSSPPTSRSSTPRPDKRRKPFRNHSASTLAGLMESSMMFAAPGSNKGIAEAVEKVKHEVGRSKRPSRSKRKAEEYSIKVHIAEIISRQTYLLKLCRALMTYGAPTHRLEAYMRMSARVLGIEGQFLYLPDTMIISFDDSDTHTTEVKIVRAGQGLDFGKLRDVHLLYKEVLHDRISVDEATARLNDITGRKPKFPVWLRILLYGVASAMVAPFGFEGRYIDMPICFILGCLVGFLQLQLSPSNELYANVFEITAAVATSFLARLFGSVRGGNLFCFSSLAQASIALILPGYMVLCASLELQSHQILPGSVRMVYALIYTLFLGYGFTIGSVIYGYMDSNAVSDVHCLVGDTWYTQRPPQNFYIFFVFGFTLCLCAINQAKWKQTPVQVAISLAGFCVNNFSARFFKGNGIVSSSLGALTIGVLANLYSRLGRPCQNYCLDVWEHTVEPRWRKLRSRFGPRPHHSAPSPYYNYTSAGESYDSIPRQKEGDIEMGPSPSPPSDPAPGSGTAATATGATTTTTTTTTTTGGLTPRARQIGYGLAAAAMLPAIFVQVPSGLAASGSLLSGVTSADQIVRNETVLTNGTVVNGTTTMTTTSSGSDLNNSAFSVLTSVIQVAINISVGLSLSALLVYPFGKKRSGLFSL